MTCTCYKGQAVDIFPGMLHLKMEPYGGMVIYISYLPTYRTNINHDVDDNRDLQRKHAGWVSNVVTSWYPLPACPCLLLPMVIRGFWGHEAPGEIYGVW